MRRAPGVLPRRSNLNPRYSLGNVNIVKFPVTVVCSNAKQSLPDNCSQDSAGQKRHSSCSWPFLSSSMLFPGSGLGLWLHVTLRPQLRAFRLDPTLLAINLKMLLMCTQQMDYLSSPHGEGDVMLTNRLLSCVQKRLIEFSNTKRCIINLELKGYLINRFNNCQKITFLMVKKKYFF